MPGEWMELDLTPGEVGALTRMAEEQGTVVETICSKVIRQAIALHDRLGARVALDGLDTRDRTQHRG
jgi:hypothetical protein